MRDGYSSHGELALAELPADAVSEQGTETLRWASAPYASAAGRTGTDALAWTPRLLGDVVVEQTAMDAIGAGGVVALTTSDVDLSDADGALSDLAAYGLADGRDAVVRIVPVMDRQATDYGTHWLDVPTAWRGVVRGVSRRPQQRAAISLADMTARMDVPLQPTVYVGTGGVEGGDELKDKPKPVCLGHCFNVPAVYLGNIDLGTGSLPTYQVHWRAVEDIEAVRIRGVAQTLVGGTPTTGQARVYNSTGLFQLGSSPDGEVRADVQGDNVGAYASSTADVLTRLLTSLGPTYAAADIDGTAFDLADTDLPGEIGFWQGPDPTTASAAVDRICAGSGAVLAGGRAGQIRLFDPLAVDVAQFDIPAEWIISCEPMDLPASLRPPPTAVEVEYGPNWGPHSGVAGSVAASLRQRLESGNALVASMTATSTLLRVARERPLRVPGLYWSEADAIARATAWAAWIDSGPRAFRVVTDRYLGQIECGAIGSIAYPAYGLSGGFLGTVMAWREALGGRRVEITILGRGS